MIGRPHRRALLTIAAATAAYSSFNAPAQDELVPRARPVEPVAPPAPPAGGELSTDPEVSLIQYANYVYSQRQWELAGKQYQRYLELYPKGVEAGAAWYRVGECYFKREDTASAETAYLRVIREHRKSAYAPAAAYRLGSIYYARRDYRTAHPYFEIARTRSTKAEIQLHAAYLRARSLNEIGAKPEAVAAFQKVVDFDGVSARANTFREAAMLSIARLSAETGNKKQALEQFEKLAAETKRDDIKGEALVKAGLIRSALGDEETAKNHLTAALELRGAEEWKPDAQFHLVTTYYGEKDYANVTAIYRKGAFAMPEEIRPKMLLMVGNAYRHQERYREAIDVYLILREHYPTSEEAVDAEYRKLLCFYHLRSGNLPEFVDAFVEWQTLRDPTHKHIDMAQLLKAEYLFTRGLYAPAGLAYDKIRVENIPEALRASALYKRGWAHSEGGNHPLAVRAFGDFLQNYPDDPQVSNALAKRALSFRAVEDYTSALRDLAEIIENHGDSEAAELAYQQSALIKGQQRDYKGMVESYTALLKHFPDSKAKPEALFWIGWGQYEVRNFEESATALRQARELDRATYFTRATLRIILSEYALQKVDAVRKEIEGLPIGGGGVDVPPQVFLWLGVKMFDTGDYAAATRFLNRAVTPSDPAATQAVVWKRLGQAALYSDNPKDAIVALDRYLQSHQPPTNRARVLHDKAVAHLALGNYRKAETVVEEALGLQPQSRVYGQLCNLWGEIAIRQGEWERAVQRLVKPTYAIDDEDITPTAIYKSARAHQELGQTEKAEELRARLKAKFPAYKDDQDAIKGLPPAPAA